MTQFIVASALLIVATLGLLLPPLLRRQGTAHRNWLIALVVMVMAIPLSSVWIYKELGYAEDVLFFEQMQAYSFAPLEQRELMQSQLLVDLVARTEARPENGEYWYLLGVQRMALGQHSAAAIAFEQAAGIFPEDPTIHAKWAEALFIANGFQTSPQVQSLIGRVLAIDPGEPTVLSISGILALANQLPQEAIDFWQRALQRMPLETPNAQVILQGIAQAQQMLDSNPQLASRPTEPATTAAGDSESTAVLVNLSIAEHLTASPTDTLFVFLRRPNIPMPLVVQRSSVSELPTTIRLDESLAMIPGTKLNQLEALELVARVTKSGEVTAVSGDFETVLGPLKLQAGETFIDLEIDRQIP